MTDLDRPTELAATLERVGTPILTLNRPRSLNAVNADLSEAVGAALDENDADPDVRVGIITGAGRAFCARADLKAVLVGHTLTAPGHPGWGFNGLVEHYVEKPQIAATNGVALGGGTEIVLACDLALLSENAALGLPEVKHGLFAVGGLIRMPRQLPTKLAMEAALTGEPLDPQVAWCWGVVNRVVPEDQVMASALELAPALAANASLAVCATRNSFITRPPWGLSGTARCGSSKRMSSSPSSRAIRRRGRPPAATACTRMDRFLNEGDRQC